MHIDVMLCQNHPNGNISIGCSQIDFIIDGEIFLHLDTVHGMPVPCWCNDRLIVFYDVRVKHSGMMPMVGNVFWNLYRVPDYYCQGLINLLLKSREWSCAEAYTEIFEKWHAGEEIRGPDIGIDDVPPTVVNPDQLKLF